MYLPQTINRAHVLVSVKTYPQPSQSYDELVCNAGFVSIEDDQWKWIRIYPVQFRQLPYDQQYKKFEWIELDLQRNWKDSRQESYRPKLGIDEEIKTVGSIGTGKDRAWAERKRYALREVFDSMEELIQLAKKREVQKSLATVRPKSLIRLEIEKENETEWSSESRKTLQQLSLFRNTHKSSSQQLEIVSKLPYKYYYRFVTEGDKKPRKMMIADWEIGALYWNCLAQTEGDENAANELVRQKYEEEFFEKDLYLFVGTTLANHHKARNPFMIIGVFYPPLSNQPSLFP
ncbi:MAG: hypothetical protein OXF54_12885 [Caldilineaceae bacterium]|nr:hypothetical protein [Caldilineaceae bacterium]